MTGSHEIKNSVIEWLKINDTKIFVDDGMLLRMKITHTIWPSKITFTFRANGGFIQISKVLTPCHWETVPIPRRHCLPCNDCNKKQKNHTCRITLTGTNSGSWHDVHLLHGGIGKVQGGLLIIPKVKEVSRVLSERGKPVGCSIWQASSKLTFTNLICFVTDWSFTADGGLL